MASSRELHAALMAVVAQQGGYFTARQALDAGYSYPRHHYHVQTGAWERVARGIFRMHDYPLPEREDLIVLSLMSHNRASQPEAVFSHETALALHALGDVNPARIHLTVSPHFRRKLPTGVVVHRGDVPSGDWEERDGYRVTTPLRTLIDIAGDPASWPYLEAAVRDALRQGMVRRGQLQSAVTSDEAHARLLGAIAVADEKASTSI
ncbi:MAG TPA: type IV toxin-antitoxin system AbiEi family antitoxin domain-containing protein [Ktedonobacterales bacterium]|nr:type IV toxin-antitoxin system AbiEi family antitoxin domain-containing protein [Ktedonobacterales bacterium]